MTPDLMHELLQAGTNDWVSLDEAAWIISQGEFTPTSKKQTFEGLGEIFRDSLMVPGDLGETGFEDWPGTLDDWTERMREELNRHAWPPMGAGFWMRLTAKGRTHFLD